MRHIMHSKQYEELCRYFLADKLDISIDHVKSVYIQNPTRPDLSEYKHQIDLYWECEDKLDLYINIANAKWRSDEKRKVKQGEVLLLQQVKQDVAAHKAMMITNIGFTSGAISVAENKGISLHIVTPNFDYSILSEKNSNIIKSEIQEIANSRKEEIYNFRLIHKAFDFNKIRPRQLRPQNNIPYVNSESAINYTTKVVRNVTSKSEGGGSANRGSGDSGQKSEYGLTKGIGPSKTK